MARPVYHQIKAVGEMELMQSPALDHGSPILEEKASVKWRDENPVYIRARKARCHSVWCPSCSKLEWAKRSASDLREFDWKRTRQVVLTIDPGQFKDGKEAYDYVMEHKVIPGFARNLRRGKHVKVGKHWVWKYKPVEIIKYMTFLEWHRNGFPHWHVFIETTQYGRFAQIGQDMIHHYWPVAKIIHEDFIKSQKHWDDQVGYFQKNGYFHKDKEHQTRLPKWALEIPGLKIRRLSHSRRPDHHPSGGCGGDQDEKEAWIIDPVTGEALEPGSVTYHKRLDFCGRYAIFRIYIGNKEVDGLFNIPYRDVRKIYPGQYRAGIGYMFRVDPHEADKLLGKMIRGKVIEWPERDLMKETGLVQHWCPVCDGVAYQKIQYTVNGAHVYQCRRCETFQTYSGGKVMTWQAPERDPAESWAGKEPELCPV